MAAAAQMHVVRRNSDPPGGHAWLWLRSFGEAALAVGPYKEAPDTRSPSMSQDATVAGTWVRPLHRWLSIAFTLTVVANFAVRARGEPAAWVTYSPLVPLALLLLTGLYLFALPHAARWRRRKGQWSGSTAT